MITFNGLASDLTWPDTVLTQTDVPAYNKLVFEILKQLEGVKTIPFLDTTVIDVELNIVGIPTIGIGYNLFGAVLDNV